MEPDRDISQGKTALDLEKLFPVLRAAAPGDQSSLERLQGLLADKRFEESWAKERLRRGVEAAELLGKLGMDVETLSVAALLPLVEGGALDAVSVKQYAGAEIARLIEGACRIAILKDLRKPASESVQANRLRQLLLTIAEDPRVVLVSLAHQLCILRAAMDAPAMTRLALGQETLDVFAPLANRLGVWQLKQELEAVPPRILE
jgi:GTP pyrophosphokinase